MYKKLNGYFTIEAAFILPMILFLYLLIILAALYLYCRCAISQDNFLLGMRAERFTWGEDYYGEIIYGKEMETSWPVESYVQERLVYKKAFYPFYTSGKGECRITNENVTVQTGEKGSSYEIVKKVQRMNPIEMIREGRRNYNV